MHYSLFSVWLFVTLVSGALFSLCSIWFFVTFFVSCTMLSVFCLIFCYVSVPRTMLSVLCLIFRYVSVSCTILSVFCLIVCYVSVSRTFVSVQFDFLLHKVLKPFSHYVMFDCSIRWCLAHYSLCVLSEVRPLINLLPTLFLCAFFLSMLVLCTVLFVFCLIVCYVGLLVIRFRSGPKYIDARKH